MSYDFALQALGSNQVGRPDWVAAFIAARITGKSTYTTEGAELFCKLVPILEELREFGGNQ